jgi:hypothetical protein
MNRKISWLKRMAIAGLFAAALAVSGAGNAQNLVQNGEFNNPGVTPNNFFPNATVADWFLAGWGGDVVIYAPYGANPGSSAPLHLWTTLPPDNTPNGLATTPTSPKDPGTNYLAADADPSLRPSPTSINQYISITTGNYVLNFDYAAAQYTDKTHATQDAWQVSLGGTVMAAPPPPAGTDTVVTGGTVLTNPNPPILNGKTTTTPVLNNVGQGFTGWQEDSVPFTATSAEINPFGKSLLSFLAVSPSTGLPPVVLLDSVSILPACVATTAASYIGKTCAIGDKEFSNFQYTPTAIGSAVASSAAQTMITPVMSGNNEGFNIQGLWDAGPGGAADGVLSYTVQSMAGDTIDDASLSLTGSAFGGGFATVGETICEGDYLSDGCASGTSATLQGFLPSAATENITFDPTDLVDISKDIDVFGGSGFASLSDVIDTVSQCATCDPPDPPAVPEPPSLALLGGGLAGLAGLGLVRRRRC